jgi:hypothetical protein
LPVTASQTRAVLLPAVTMRDPSWLKAADLSQSSWPLRTAIALPVAPSQTRAVLSSDVVTMRDPSGLKPAHAASRRSRRASPRVSPRRSAVVWRRDIPAPREFAVDGLLQPATRQWARQDAEGALAGKVVPALVRQGLWEDAIAFTEVARSSTNPGFFEMSIDRFCEKLLIEHGRADEGYRRYGLRAASGTTASDEASA